MKRAGLVQKAFEAPAETLIATRHALDERERLEEIWGCEPPDRYEDLDSWISEIVVAAEDVATRPELVRIVALGLAAVEALDHVHGGDW